MTARIALFICIVTVGLLLRDATVLGFHLFPNYMYVHIYQKSLIVYRQVGNWTIINSIQTNPKFPSANQWDQVDDFNWLKADHSPNWSILAPQDAVLEEKWTEIVPGGPEWSLDNILQAVGVGKL